MHLSSQGSFCEHHLLEWHVCKKEKIPCPNKNFLTTQLQHERATLLSSQISGLAPVHYLKLKKKVLPCFVERRVLLRIIFGTLNIIV